MLKMSTAIMQCFQCIRNHRGLAPNLADVHRHCSPSLSCACTYSKAVNQTSETEMSRERTSPVCVSCAVQHGCHRSERVDESGGILWLHCSSKCPQATRKRVRRGRPAACQLEDTVYRVGCTGPWPHPPHVRGMGALCSPTLHPLLCQRCRTGCAPKHPSSQGVSGAGTRS